VWTVCDDDIVKPQAFSKIITILKKTDNLCSVFINYSVYNGDITICKEERAVKLYKDISCTPNTFYEITKSASAVASSNIILRSLWTEVIKESHLSSRWVHLECLAAIRIQNPKYISYCVSEPLLILRQGFVKWGVNGGLYLLTLNLLPIFKKFKEIGYTHKTTQIMIQTIQNPMWGIIITSKVNGLIINHSLLKRSWVLMEGFSYMRVINMILLLIPRLFHIVGYNIIKLIKHTVMK
jgi:hypothetical protein